MSFILKLKHWQVFLIMLITSVAANFTWVDHELFNTSINATGSVFYFFWYFSVGLELTEYLPPRVELPRTLFIVNAFVISISLVLIIAVFNGHYSADGIIGGLWVLYMIFAVFQFIFFPCKALRTVEQGTEAYFGQYFIYALLIVLWPIGVWWIQPKLNRISNS